ncbi:MAG TPA: SgcJ/EcaC family oxidoreductase [Geminicoccaceae bacterium]|nr:SgcJ/EcaC family oxidoreductase [Geminicoccaceae bacterium]
MHGIGVILLVVLAGIGIGTARAASPEEDVKAAYATFNEAFNRGDAAAVAASYTEDAIFLPATHDVVEGPAKVQEFFAGMFAGGVTGHELELIEVMGDDELIVAAAKWSARGKDAQGADATFGGVATHVFERQPDGSLKLRLHTFN